jgi:heat shock protein HtpX
MDWSPDRGLQVRMLVTLLALLVVTLAFVAGFTLGVAGLLTLLGWSVLPGAALGLLLLCGLLVAELHQRNRLVAAADAHLVDSETAPDLHRVVDGVARQANLPAPEVAVAETDTPEAFTAGYTPDRATLVVSLGLLDALDEAELRAVVAHELAHVRNRDAAVMTAASLPASLADRLVDWATETEGDWVEHGGRYRPRSDRGGVALLAAVVLLFGRAFRFVGRLVQASLSRARETAADRGAVAITGDPAALASALSTISDELARRPTTDLRRHPGLVPLVVVAPRDAAPEEPVRLGPEGEEAAWATFYGDRLGALVESLVGDVLATHPPVAARVERLQVLQRDLAA